MRRWMKIVCVVVVLLAVVLSVAISATIGWRVLIGPEMRPLTARKFEATPARLERGRYLTENSLACFACHSERNWQEAGAPPFENKKGAGYKFPVGNDFPGQVYAPNITPDMETGAGQWSDDALALAIREGIGHDGRVLFPIMPYNNYSKLSDEDLASVVVYLRSIPAVRNPLPQTEIRFPLNMLINSAPKAITEPVAAPDFSDQVKRGSYLAQLSSCSDCHSPHGGKGEIIPETEFAGGLVFDEGPTGKVASANLTPDPTGIIRYDEAKFLTAMRTGMVGPRPLSPVMPWAYFGKMSDDDLKAIYAYLKTVKPIKHVVDNNDEPSECQLCHEVHGGGKYNR